jgi:hypothetical protein
MNLRLGGGFFSLSVEEIVKNWKKMENFFYLCPLRIRIERNGHFHRRIHIPRGRQRKAGPSRAAQGCDAAWKRYEVRR